MKYKLDIQFFGGRGQTWMTPGGRGGRASMNFAPSTATYLQFPELRDALGKKGTPINLFDAADGANPFYDESHRQEPYNINCQRCVVAYERRRRGYDVVAQPNPNDKWASVKYDQNSKKYYALWKGAFRHAKTDNVLGNSLNKTIDNAIAKMKEYGNGSRAVIEFLRDPRGGHVINVENRNGKILFVEAQTTADSKGGHIYSRKELAFQMGDRTPRHAALTRTDNLQISYRSGQFVDQKKRIRGQQQ